MRKFQIMRALLALICIVLLVCAASAPGFHFDLAVPAVAFTLLVFFAVSLLPVVQREPATQLLSFLTLDISRAPPQA